MALGLGESLAGSRFQKGFVLPGGVARDPAENQLAAVSAGLAQIMPLAEESFKVLFENPGVIERTEGIGVLQASLAEEFCMVGPAARASGSAYDARRCFRHGLYPDLDVKVAQNRNGDVLARAMVRKNEAVASMETLEAVLSDLPATSCFTQLGPDLPRSRGAVGVVESWRGELVHWITTGRNGEIERYALRDPSFQNWTGLAIAVRNNLVADFPMINKSFSLSYSGNDL